NRSRADPALSLTLRLRPEGSMPAVGLSNPSKGLTRPRFLNRAGGWRELACALRLRFGVRRGRRGLRRSLRSLLILGQQRLKDLVPCADELHQLGADLVPAAALRFTMGDTVDDHGHALDLDLRQELIAPLHRVIAEDRQPVRRAVEHRARLAI